MEVETTIKAAVAILMASNTRGGRIIANCLVGSVLSQILLPVSTHCTQIAKGCALSDEGLRLLWEALF